MSISFLEESNRGKKKKSSSLLGGMQRKRLQSSSWHPHTIKNTLSTFVWMTNIPPIYQLVVALRNSILELEGYPFVHNLSMTRCLSVWEDPGSKISTYELLLAIQAGVQRRGLTKKAWTLPPIDKRMASARIRTYWVHDSWKCKSKGLASPFQTSMRRRRESRRRS